MPDSKRPSVLRVITGNLGAQMGLLALSLAKAVVQNRVLGPAGSGEVNLLVASAILTSTALTLGLQSASTHAVASGTVGANAVYGYLKLLWTKFVVVVACVTPLIFMFGFQRFVFPPSISSSAVYLLFIAYFASTLATGWLAALHQSQLHLWIINRSFFVSLGIALVGICGVGFLKHQKVLPNPVLYVVMLLTLTEVVKTVLLFFGLRHWMKAEPSQRMTKEQEKGLWGYSRFSFASELVQFLNYRMDFWIINALQGPAALGLYSNAVTLAQLVWLFPSALGQIVFLSAARMSLQESGKLALRIARLSLYASAGAALFGMSVAPWLMPRLFGEAFRGSTALLGILLVGVVPYSLAKVSVNYLAGINALKPNFVIACLGLVMCTGLDFLLIPRIGAVGACWASVISYLFYVVLSMIVLFRKSGLPWTDLFSTPRADWRALQEARAARSH